MRVLLGYDGSTGATEAVAFVASIAWPSDSLLQVLNVVEPIIMATPGPWGRGMTASPQLDAAITGYAHESVRDVVRRLSAPGRSVEGVVARGRAASSIIDAARDLQADLIIVGSRGRGSIASLLLGSVAGEVADQASCPVLVARTATLSQVVFATDESSSARGAEALLAQWPIFGGLPIHVVSVADLVDPWTAAVAPAMFADEYTTHLREATLEHERVAADAAARLRDAGRTADAETREGDAAREIIAVAEERAADLIVLGSRGRTGLTRVLLGSVARNVLFGSGASVLIVRDAGEQSAGTEARPD